MKVFKIFVDMDQEEKYLNEMAQKGFLLQKYSAFGVYTFKEGEPQDLHYKVDYRVFKGKVEFVQYKTFFEDAGWEHVYGTTYTGSQYFLPKPGCSEETELFSDAESKAARYKRFLQQCVVGFTCMMVYLVVVLATSGFKLVNLGYLTPGLWEKTGISFWYAFIFETPFVILRFIPLFILLFFTVVYGYWGYKGMKLYRKSLLQE